MSITAKLKIRPYSVLSRDTMTAEPEVGHRLIEILNDLAPKKAIKRNLLLPTGTYIRLENIENPTKKIWLLNFAKSRDTHGPGKISQNAPLAEIDLKADESFGEESAALYCTETRHLLIQENLPLVSIRSIQNYINAQGGEKFCALDPVPDEEVEQQFQSTGEAKKIHFKIVRERCLFDPTHTERGLENAFDMATSTEAATVEVKISAGKGTSGERLYNIAKRLQSIFHSTMDDKTTDNKKSGINKLVVWIKDPDEKTAMLDLLKPRMLQEFDITLDNKSRIPLQKRYDALIYAHKSWRKYLSQRRP